MRLAPEKPWVPFQAEQEIFAERVAFEWVARLRLAPMLWVKVVDAYEDQRGRLRASLWGVIPVAGARGPEVDRGEIQRYLAELPWCPGAFANNRGLNFRCSADDEVRVWVGDEGTYVDLRFDDQGDITRARSETRHRHGIGRQPWEGRFEDYAEIGGSRVPRRAAVRWQTPEGPFEYWRGEVVSWERVPFAEERG